MNMNIDHKYLQFLIDQFTPGVAPPSTQITMTVRQRDLVAVHRALKELDARRLLEEAVPVESGPATEVTPS
jgi:hypothetical protein